MTTAGKTAHLQCRPVLLGAEQPMTEQSGSAIRRGEQGRVEADLSGAVDADAVKRLSAAVTAALRDGPAPAVLIRLLDVPLVPLDAREVLAELQRTLAARVRRTAYVADRPAVRGAVQWAITTAGDQNAKVVPTAELAEQWLRESAGRTEDTVGKTRALLKSIEESMEAVRRRADGIRRKEIG